ncbi:hypothetical protein RHMOL_Rhmol08G0233200 [Rhododendron molle]|uniref:Uncharacterized protein n=1 Tax=Rhododendron molle TaxID=49168 RepID=A0ACC0MTI2_RHOML|nr:hypothetical protein RHMOL_Rhmol08G0233200 [Rhododendron molle]
MLRSTSFGIISEGETRGDRASAPSPPSTLQNQNPIRRITTDLPHRITLPRWFTHDSTQA